MSLDPAFEELLRARGATDDDLADAESFDQHQLNALAAELLLWPRGSLTRDDVATRAGVSADQLATWWRGLGMPDGRQSALSDDDVEMAKVIAALAAFSPDPAVVGDLVRVVGASIQMLANASVNAMRVGFEQPMRQSGVADSTISKAYADVVAALLPGVTRVFDILLRRYIVGAVYEQVAVSEAGAVQSAVTIVFVDLVDYTGLTQRASAAELAATLSRFEAAALDVAVNHRGRLVKMLGDGAMLSFGTPAQALAAARELADRGELPALRVGVATGRVLTRQGDYYGPAVNLAARLSGVGRPGDIVVDSDHGLAGLEPLDPVTLKGLDTPVDAYRVRR